MQLSKNVVQQIAEILAQGHDAKVTQGRHGVVVYEMRVRKKYDEGKDKAQP